MLDVMHFNFPALLCGVAFIGAVAVAVSSGANSMHLMEATATVLIALGVGSVAIYGRKPR
jgi:hypothetical protein